MTKTLLLNFNDVNTSNEATAVVENEMVPIDELEKEMEPHLREAAKELLSPGKEVVRELLGKLLR